MRTRSSLPVILFLDPYLTAKVQARAMDAASVLAQDITEARLIEHILTLFFQHEREIAALLNPVPESPGWEAEDAFWDPRWPLPADGSDAWTTWRDAFGGGHSARGG